MIVINYTYIYVIGHIKTKLLIISINSLINWITYGHVLFNFRNIMYIYFTIVLGRFNVTYKSYLVIKSIHDAV